MIRSLPLQAPARILQFGGGNFLRAFTDWMIDILNEETDFNGSIIIVKPTPTGDYEKLRKQEGLYQVLLSGVQEGKQNESIRLITCIKDIIHPYSQWEAYLKSAEIPSLRFIIYNTTEAGIRYNADDPKPLNICPREFPAKLTWWLWMRYKHFKGAQDKGCIILPLELIADNGTALKATVMDYANSWQLEADFLSWLIDHNCFCNTLVDRIVSGYPETQALEIFEANGVKDELLVAGESYHSWIIEAPSYVAKELPFDQTNLNVNFAEDLDIHRQIKVKILNGAHTSMVPVGILAGLELVSEAIKHPLIGAYIEHLLCKEVLPCIDFDKEELEKYVHDVIDRFKNPQIRHKLRNIALNSSSKYRSRLLPSFFDYLQQKKRLPAHIVFALAALVCMYKGTWEGKEIDLQDDPEILRFFRDIWNRAETNYQELAYRILERSDIWGKDLTEIDELVDALAVCVELIVNEGMEGALSQLMTHISN